MAIENGLVLLIQMAMGSPPTVPGGFMAELPKNVINNPGDQAWVYKSRKSEPTYILSGQDGFTSLHWQIDCHGFTAIDAVSLATLVDSMLRGGFSGVLSDSAQTVVQGIFREEEFLDGYAPGSRTYVRSLFYEIQYQQV